MSASRFKLLRPKWIIIGVVAIALASAGVWWTVTNDGLSAFTSRSEAQSDTSLLPISFGGKCGYVDAAGKMVINPQFDNAHAFSPSLGVAPVLVGGKWGLIDRDGKYVINPQFNEVGVDPGSNSIRVNLSGKWGTIDRDGKFVINPQFDGLYQRDSTGLSIVQVGKKQGIIDANGKFVVSPEFDGFVISPDNRGPKWYFLDRPLGIIREGKFGYIDSKGKVIIQPQFAEAGDFDSRGFAFAAIEETNIVELERTRNANADVAEQIIRNKLSSYISGDIKRENGNITFDIYDSNMGKPIMDWVWQNIDQRSWELVARGAPSEPNAQQSIFLQQKVVEAPKKNKYGYVGTDGKFIISPQFDQAGYFTESDLAYVKIGDVYGYIDRKGKLVINPQFATASPFARVNGAWVSVVGVSDTKSDKIQYGLIDAKGNYLVNPQFSGLGTFGSGGLAVAQSGDLFGAVDMTGRYILQPIYSTLLPIDGGSKFIFIKAIAGADDMSEIGVVDSSSTVITTVRGGTCGGIYSFS